MECNRGSNHPPMRMEKREKEEINEGFKSKMHKKNNKKWPLHYPLHIPSYNQLFTTNL